MKETVMDVCHQDDNRYQNKSIEILKAILEKYSDEMKLFEFYITPMVAEVDRNRIP